ncbi:sensor histidine kinase [Phragmitibacter flavus]|uniref:Sensor histidine kinase n=1 Tax=Phragmitibacter flavus TaxID=2576071 RepID=A0A5R8KHS7_9BACT|nr:sensor histidine kinase [Phragmitibacter flavus]
MRHLLITLIPLTLLIANATAQTPVLREITEVRALPPEQAARNLPVEIEAIVTFINPSLNTIILNDGREGIYVTLPKPAQPEIRNGTILRLTGHTQPGGFLPIIAAEKWLILDQQPTPTPKRIHAAELFSPSLDCQWVQVSAIVTGANDDDDNIIIPTAEISGWTVRLLVPPGEKSLQHIAHIMQQPVTITGVVGSVFNDQRQLVGRHFFLTSAEQIVPTETPAPSAEAPLRAVNELLRSDSNSHTRVRVRGIVTRPSSDGLFIRGEGGSLFIRSVSHQLTPGTRIEAEGFAAVAPFRPVLRATRVTPVGQALAPQPLQMDPAGQDLSPLQSELVAVEATLQALRTGTRNETVLQCRARDWFFEAILPPGQTTPTRLVAGSRIQLVGICELTTTHALPFSQGIDGFRLHLSHLDDITILQLPPWWTLPRLLWALAIIAAVALAFFTWASLLRRRVSEQTKTIRDQIERAAVKDERQRIARELHDTIEQELAGLSIQLRNARQRMLSAPDQAGQSLSLAEQMLRHCREEARTSIRDLRSAALEVRGLHGALEELLTPTVNELGAHFSLQSQGQPYPLTGPAEIHLLRIAHEAVVNASRHASPKIIQVTLQFEPDTITLEIRDDGTGFDPAQSPPRGHFGLLGMRERSNKLHATLTIDSTPGKGTTIRIIVPAASARRPSQPATFKP